MARRTMARWLLVLAGMGISAAATAEVAVTGANQIIERYMAEDGLPSLSVAVGRDGRVLFAGAVGLIDLENGVPATASSAKRPWRELVRSTMGPA